MPRVRSYRLPAFSADALFPSKYWLRGLLPAAMAVPFALIPGWAAQPAPMLFAYSSLLLGLRAGLLAGLALSVQGDRRFTRWICCIALSPLAAATMALMLPSTEALGILLGGHVSALLVEHHLRKTGLVPGRLWQILVAMTALIAAVLVYDLLFGR